MNKSVLWIMILAHIFLGACVTKSPAKRATPARPAPLKKAGYLPETCSIDKPRSGLTTLEFHNRRGEHSFSELIPIPPAFYVNGSQILSGTICSILEANLLIDPSAEEQAILPLNNEEKTFEYFEYIENIEIRLLFSWGGKTQRYGHIWCRLDLKANSC
jgi:hypothetical protein